MRRIYSNLLRYPGYHGSCAHCWLDIYADDPDRPAVVIVTEARDNGGTSVTHAIETIAALTVHVFDLDPDCTLFVEHYHASRALHLSERFAFVEFHRNSRQRPGSLGQPTWIPVSKQRIEYLIGHALLEPRP